MWPIYTLLLFGYQQPYNIKTVNIITQIQANAVAVTTTAIHIAVAGAVALIVAEGPVGTHAAPNSHADIWEDTIISPSQAPIMPTTHNQTTM